MGGYHRAFRRLALPFAEEELLYGPGALEDEEEFNLPPCPGTLVVVDVQEEFNRSIGFDTRAFLAWLRECAGAGTDIHIVYDEFGDEPAMFAPLGPTYYAKTYGADPYEGVVDRETGEEVDPSDAEDGVVYRDPAAGLDVFRSSGHEWQHVSPGMTALAGRLRGRPDVALVGGAANECLRDMMEWLDISGVGYRVEWRFVYG